MKTGVIPDFELTQWALSGGVIPFSLACINPASIDLRWSGRYRIATPTGWSAVQEANSITIAKGEFYLLDTLETVTVPLNWSGMLALKSSLGRNGLEHLHAGFFDPGFRGTATLEVHVIAPWPVVLVKEQRIVQLVFTEMKATPEKSYRVTGRYNDQSEPEPERE